MNNKKKIKLLKIMAYALTASMILTAGYKNASKTDNLLLDNPNTITCNKKVEKTSNQKIKKYKPI